VCAEAVKPGPEKAGLSDDKLLDFFEKPEHETVLLFISLSSTHYSKWQ
jgi:hypothetical protein